MKKRKFKFRGRLLAVVSAIILMAAPAFAQTSKSINWERMRRDLDIMESVLSKMLFRSSVEWGPAGDHVNGVYFEGYGVVFQVEYHSLRIYALTDKELKKSLHELHEVVPEELGEDAYILAPEPPEPAPEPETPIPGRVTQVIETNSEKRLERLKTQVTEFLADYTDAIGQLDAGDRVTVVMDLTDSDHFQIVSDAVVRKRKSKDVSLLEISALKSDVVEHRRGKMTLEDFRKRIAVNERGNDEGMARNMDIMASIIETALSRRHHEDYYLVGKSRGVYLKGLGSLFFMNAELNLGTFYVPEGEFGESKDVVRVRVQKGQNKTKKNPDDLLRGFEDSLVELVGDYGHTLHTIAPDEQVVAAVNFNNYWGISEDAPKRFILKVKKQDLDSYNRGSIKLAEFKQRVKIQQY